MALLENRLVQLALAMFVAYVVLNMATDKTQEGMETDVTVAVNGNTVATVSGAAGSGSGYTDDQMMQHMSVGSASGSNVVDGGDTNFGAGPQQGSVPPAPLVSGASNLMSTAPAGDASSMQQTLDDKFAPEPIDYDTVFEKRDQLDASELIIKADPGGLYQDLQASDSTNFLVNSWNLGISTDQGKSRPINDPRKVYDIPVTILSPFNSPTKHISLQNRRSYADIE